jgi:hypothetical protein
MWDFENTFAHNQAVTATAVSDNVVKVPAGDIGKGRPLFLKVLANGYGGTGSLTVNVQTYPLATMANAVVVARHPISNEKLLAGGEVLRTSFPTGCSEWLRLQFEVTGTLTGGTISAAIELD